MASQPDYFSQLEHADIDELADAIGELLQNPITIEDADHRLIAYSLHGDSTDHARWSTIMGRRVPEKVLTRLWKDGVFQQLWTQDDPVHVPAKDEVGLGNRVAIAIRKGSDILGYIWAQEVNRPFTETDDEILRQAARVAVPRLVQRQGKHKRQEQRRKEFFWELLLGNHTSDASVRKKAEALQVELPSPFVVCILESAVPQLEQLLYPLLSRGRLLWVCDGTELVCLIGLSPVAHKEGISLFPYAERFIQEATGKLREKFQQAEAVGVYGRCYQAYADIQRSYREALHVLAIKRLFAAETKGVTGYHDLGIYRFLPELKKWAKAQGYENERLSKLKEYDRANQTNLTETLETFLDTAGKLNVTAQRLHIHINTLSYRLKRAEEIMGVQLDDANQRTNLYLDLKLDKMGDIHL